MLTSELFTRSHPEHRRVGVTYPTRTPVVLAAKRVYLELGLDVTIEENGFYVEVPRVAAPWTAGLLERATGRVAFNDWDDRPGLLDIRT